MERRVEFGDGVRLRYAGLEQPASAAVAAELATRVERAFSEALQLLDRRLGLAVPNDVEVVIQDLGAGLDAYCVADGESASILLDSAQTADAQSFRDNLIRQLAQVAVAHAGPHGEGRWSAAFADWLLTELDGVPRPEALAAASAALDRLDQGLFHADATGGQWIWFAFLDQAYGPTAVSLSIRELAGDADTAAAFDRAVKNATGDTLSKAFREFHLWSLMTGGRADGYHFDFASAITMPAFASESDGLPALSVQTDAAMGLWSATQVRLVPDAGDGGLGVRFEGEFGSVWEADLLVVDGGGRLRRMEIDLHDGAGGAVVPLENVAEALLLIRRLAGDAATARYTYAGHRDGSYPWVLAATAVSRQPLGAVVEWETGSELDLIAFNVLRSRVGGSLESAVNTVWIPALGERDESTLYEFLDRDALPGVAYRYRIEAITSGGWTSRSPYFVLRAP